MQRTKDKKKTISRKSSRGQILQGTKSRRVRYSPVICLPLNDPIVDVFQKMTLDAHNISLITFFLPTNWTTENISSPSIWYRMRIPVQQNVGSACVTLLASDVQRCSPFIVKRTTICTLIKQVFHEIRMTLESLLWKHRMSRVQVWYVLYNKVMLYWKRCGTFTSSVQNVAALSSLK